MPMETLTLIYWSRACLGVGAALLCTLFNMLTAGSLNFFNNVSITLLVYIITYYIYKWRFLLLVEKPTKIATQGIGAYFLTWIVALGLFHTIWLSST